MERTLVRVSTEDHGPTDAETLPMELAEGTTLNFAALVRLLLEVIPNPWQAARILRETLDALRERNVSEDRLFINRLYLVKAMRDDLRAQVNAAGEREFREMLGRGELSFRLTASGDPELNWIMPETETLDVAPDDQVLRRKSGEDLKRSLFEPVYQKQVNGLEKNVAWYLDDASAVRWWHRIAVSSHDWHLQGWQKNKVYPDFLACVEEGANGATRFTVLESKGLHLKGNDDTEYKRRLFELLTAYDQTALPIGELTLGVEPTRMRFELMLESDWQESLSATFNKQS